MQERHSHLRLSRPRPKKSPKPTQEPKPFCRTRRDRRHLGGSMNSDAMMIVLVHLSIVFLGTPGLGRRRLHLAIKIGKTKSGSSGINHLKILRYPRAKSCTAWQLSKISGHKSPRVQSYPSAAGPGSRSSPCHTYYWGHMHVTCFILDLMTPTSNLITEVEIMQVADNRGVVSLYRYVCGRPLRTNWCG